MRAVQEFYDWLLPLVEDGGSEALRQISELARVERELYFKGPAMAAMLCWKATGIEAIVRIAVSNPTSKNISSAYKLLSSVSAGVVIDPSLHFIHSDALTTAVNAVLKTTDLRQSAREYLAELLQSLDLDDLLIPLGVAFSGLSLASGRVAAELIRAMSARWLQVGPTVMKAYAALIHQRGDEEPAFQGFFCQHPQLLDPMALEVWDRPGFHGALEPDWKVVGIFRSTRALSV